MKDEWRVNSIIARPYKKIGDKYVLTSDTKRYTFDPPTTSVLDNIKANNLQTISIGKISNIFNNQGITKIIKSSTNNDAINKLLDIMDKDFNGLCFVNLPDFDTLYGHARNVMGYKEALEEFDVLVPLIINKLNLDDLLIITADHGNDPTMEGVSHTRENVPVLIYSRSLTGSGQIDILDTFADIGATITEAFEIEQKPWIGTSFLNKLK
jgi:phosphopentomutase